MPLTDPVPSNALDVLKRNAEDFDRFVVGSLDTFQSRNGETKLTINGIIDRANEVINNLGLEYPPIAYTSGLTVERNTQTYLFNDVIYINTRTDLPFTTTGSFDEGGWQIVQQVNQSTVIFASDGIKGLESVALIDRAQYSVAGFYAGTEIGGGEFIYDASRSKADHNGGTVIDPVRVAAWDGTKDDLATLWTTGTGTGVFVRKNVEDTAKLTWYGWFPSDATQDAKPIIDQAASDFNHVQVDARQPAYLGSTFEYPRNAFTLSGLYGAAYSSNSQIRPISTAVIGDFTDNALIDMNESGSDAAQGGSFNTLKDLLIFGGMADFKDSGDPLVGLIGVRGINTFFRFQMERVTFRNCGIPFDLEGFMHVLRDVNVYQCYQGPNLDSTLSSTLDTFQLVTCAKNWGTYSNCKVQNATIQQGNELPTLDDNAGMTINGIVIFDNVFTEGGNAHYLCSESSILHLKGCTLGYTQLEPSGYGSYNIKANTDCEIYIDESCRIGGPRSFLIDTPENAKVIKVEFEYDGRFSNTADANELPNYLPSTLFVKRSYGTLNRVNYINEFTYERISLGTGSAVIFDQLTTPGTAPFGGDIYIQAGGSGTYDKYHVEFADSTTTTENVTINTKFRNTGGSGASNIDLTYSGGQLVAQGKLSNQLLVVRVVSTGAMYLKEITVTP